MKTEPFDIRLAKPADAEALSLFVNSAYRGKSSQKGWTTEASILDGQRTDPVTLTEKIQNEQTAILLFHRENQLVACVALEKKEHAAHLGMLAVLPNLQAMGIGRYVIDYSERWVPEHWHVFEIDMTVISCRSELIAWYRRRGYAPNGLKQPFPYGDERFGIPKVPNLEFVVLAKKLRK